MRITIGTVFAGCAVFGLMWWAGVERHQRLAMPPVLAGEAPPANVLPSTGLSPLAVGTSWLPAAPPGVAATGLTELVRRVRPSVALIRVDASDDKGNRVTSLGTGFLIDSRGYWVTNSHVIETPAAMPHQMIEAQCVNAAGSGQAAFLPAELVARDELADVAVLKTDQNWVRIFGLKPLKFADPEKIEPGREVVAIGFGLGLDGMPSVTRGIISATGRPGVERRENGDAMALGGLVQTDAALNHGNSGGPLLDSDGEVVGVNTLGSDVADYVSAKQLEGVKDNPVAVASILLAHQPQGVNYAISARVARACADQMIAQGKLNRGRLGVSVVSITEADAHALAEHLVFTGRGALVREVEAGSPAADAGIGPTDLITRIGDDEVLGEGDLNNAMIWHHPGEQVRVTVEKEALKRWDQRQRQFYRNRTFEEMATSNGKPQGGLGSLGAEIRTVTVTLK